MARAFGAYAERVTDPEDTEAALDSGIRAILQGQPALLGFITEKEIQISED